MKLMAKMGAAATMGAPMPATEQHEYGAAEGSLHNPWGSVECDGGQWWRYAGPRVSELS